MAKQQDDTLLSWTATLLALPPIGMLFFSDMLAYRFAWNGPAPELAKLSPAMLRLDASGRFLMLAAALITFAMAYLIALRFASDLRDEFGPDTRRWVLGWYCGGILLGAIWVFTGMFQVLPEKQLGADFFAQALGVLGPAGGSAGEGLLQNFHWLALATRVAVMLAAGMVVAGGISSLVDPVPRLEGDAARVFLAHQRDRLRSYVNTAAALLVVNLLFQIAWMRWPLVALDARNAEMLSTQIDAAAVYTGVTGSVVIALFAIPASTLLAARAAARPAAAGADANAPLLNAGLLPSLSKILVILAPTLAGSLPSLVDFIAEVAKP